MSDVYSKLQDDVNSVRTDLALEAHQVIVERQGGPEIAGVRVETESKPEARVSRVYIETEQGAQAMGKAKGTYVTLEAPALRERNKEAQEDVAAALAQEIAWFLDHLQIGAEAPCLVVGLGNWNATPDALGPRAVSELLVTRHLHEMSPPELRGGLRPVSAIAPGVLGLTGIETGEIIRGIVDRIQPELVVCIDALAARSSERLCTTIQLADTGITPGAGVGNKRLGITAESMGVPVLALGVPTVIHAMTIVSDALDLMQPGGKDRQDATRPAFTGAKGVRLDPSRINLFGSGAQAQRGAEQPRHDALGLPLDPAQKRVVLQHVLGPQFGQMIVTPKEIDALIDDVAECLAGALNTALHPALDLDDILTYLQG